MISPLNILSVLLLSLSVLAKPHASPNANIHRDLALRARGDLQKRGGFSGRFTWFADGLGACGKYNTPSQHIVALNSAQYGGGSPGPQCFKMISITANGKTATAQIMDECPGCPYGGLDMSTGLFQVFADLGAGVLQGTWDFIDGSGNSGNNGDSGAAKPSPTSTWHPPPSTTHHDPPFTPADHVATTTSKSKETSDSTTSTSTSTSKTVDVTSGAASGLAVPSGTSQQGVLGDLTDVMLGMGGIVGAGGHI